MRTNLDELMILRRVLYLHIEAFLSDGEPLLLLECTTVTKEGDTLKLRRYWKEAHENCASHVSYLGKRMPIIEHSNDGWKNTYTSITIEGYYPLPKGLMNRAIDLLKKYPECDSESVVETLLTHYKINTNNKVSKWTQIYSYLKSYNSTNKTFLAMVTALLKKVKSQLKL